MFEVYLSSSISFFKYLFTDNGFVMPAEATTTGTYMEGEPSGPDTMTDGPITAEHIDDISVNAVAAREGTINSIGEEQQAVIQQLLEEGHVIDTESIASSLNEMQRERMAEVLGDESIVVAHLPSSTAGLYDGESIVVDANCIERGVVEHEMQHRRDGLPENLDDDLFKATGNTVIDAKMENIGSMRDLLEERAMDAAGEIPDAYRDTYWATVKELEERGKAAGVDMESANSEVVVGGDQEGFRRKLLEIAFKEIAKEDKAKLVTIVANTKDTVIREVGIEVLQQAA